jgi:UDP-2-acetamido-3-amino-2,3-dideoxy-glucuronate N-acetyltransferase
MIGNPARLSGWMSEYGHRLHFDEHGIAVCEESGQQYFFENNIVKKAVQVNKG